ncbi:tetratricopeptide repeat protein [Labedaea rhizosphaerae]|uniref:Tetratricopeptide repeat protein n=1 Tax=Labedaea rhizosphaerae TaxID=598644 RepID=A0A4R6S9N8_LABRH|nr:tetratricopeptide repeat protein [Labedaea rhizosphaerae]TDP96077.1 tetratricopeptide repeat protein [Labedaea rhizosphaerae]
MVDAWQARANELYERATFAADPRALAEGEALLDSIEADLALARGRLLHAKFLADRQEDPAELANFERAVALYVKLDDPTGEAEARFWLGLVHQVVRGDTDTAAPHFERALAGDPLVRSYAARHLGFHAQAKGDTGQAERHFEESLRLRRELGHGPATAAALLPLATLAAEAGRADEATAMLAEAERLAERAPGVQSWIAATRADLDG